MIAAPRAAAGPIAGWPDAPRAARRHLRPARAVAVGGRPRVAEQPRATSAHATLPGGARVMVERVAGADTVAVRVAWPGGFAVEEPGVRGVTSVLAATVPAACDGRVVADEVTALGGTLTGVAGRWTFGLRSRWPAASWRDGLALVAACVGAPRFESTQVDHERARLRDLAGALAPSPARTAFRVYQATRWGEHPLGRDPLGDPADLADLARADVERWWHQHYPVGAAVITVVGDVDPHAAVAALASTLGAVPAPTPVAAAPVAAPPLPAARELFVDGPDGTAAVVIGFPGLAAGHADRAALDTLAAILDGPRARLRRELVARAPVRSVRAIVVDGPDTGYLAVELDGAPPLADAVAVVAEVAGELATAGPGADELAALGPRSAPARPADPAERADRLALVALGLAAPSDAAPDREAVARVAAAVLRWDEAVIVTVRPPDHTPAVEQHRQRPVRRRPPRRPPAPGSRRGRR